jgi:probable rRNA maturation factor
MINIQIDPPYEDKISPDRIEKAAQAALHHQNAHPQAELTIVITDDQQMQELNSQYLGIDAPTDVLSFSSADEIDPESGNPYLGDILISLPRASEQASESHTTLDDEIQLLVVHGVLHLLGHDHAEPAQKEAMWSAQTEILLGLGCQIRLLPDS